MTTPGPSLPTPQSESRIVPWRQRETTSEQIRRAFRPTHSKIIPLPGPRSLYGSARPFAAQLIGVSVAIVVINALLVLVYSGTI